MLRNGTADTTSPIGTPVRAYRRPPAMDPFSSRLEGPAPGGSYSPIVITDGPLAHLAGQTARAGDQMMATGTVGADVDVETACACAAQCARNLLDHLRALPGGLDNVVRVARLTVYVAATEDFAAHSVVADAASAVFLGTFGARRGKHARTAVGVRSLPRSSPVEVDALVQVRRAAALRVGRSDRLTTGGSRRSRLRLGDG